MIDNWLTNVSRETSVSAHRSTAIIKPTNAEIRTNKIMDIDVNMVACPFLFVKILTVGVGG